jgi:hypothetical protein
MLIYLMHRMFLCLTRICSMSFPVAISNHASTLYPTMPPMITSPVQLDSSHGTVANPTLATTLHPERFEQLAKIDCQPSLSQNETPLPKSHTQSASETKGDLAFDEEKFQALQSQTQQLSDHLTDFELAWTPRSSGDDAVQLLAFPDDYSENESDWA